MSPAVLSSSSNSFLQRFAVISVCSSVLVLVLSGLAAFKLYERYVVRLAESNAVSLASSTVKVHEDLLHDTLENVPLLPDRLMRLDKTLKAFLEPYGIVKVKIFSIDGVIIYSNDLSIIGKSSIENPHLLKALSGEQSSLIQTKDQFRDMYHEDRFDVDVVESYVAMRSLDNEVIGVFEIYQDMTAFRQEVSESVIFFIFGLGIILLCVWLGTFYFMRFAARKMIAQQQLLEKLATLDEVTQLFNRAEITRHMENEWERFKRSPSSHKGLGLMMIDLDHFKRVNDSYGHLIGDKLLRMVAERLSTHLRPYNNLGRYGGEEFVLMVPDVELSELSAIGERLLQVISEEGFEINSHSLKITTSIGIAVANLSDLNLDALIKRADDCLYEAKNRGRNCVYGGAEK